MLRTAHVYAFASAAFNWIHISNSARTATRMNFVSENWEVHRRIMQSTSVRELTMTIVQCETYLLVNVRLHNSSKMWQSKTISQYFENIELSQRVHRIVYQFPCRRQPVKGNRLTAKRQNRFILLFVFLFNNKLNCKRKKWITCWLLLLLFGVCIRRWLAKHICNGKKWVNRINCSVRRSTGLCSVQCSECSRFHFPKKRRER